MSIFDSIFGFDLLGYNWQQDWQEQIRYAQNWAKLKNKNNEVKVDPNVIDAEFEVVEVKELEKL